MSPGGWGRGRGGTGGSHSENVASTQSNRGLFFLGGPKGPPSWETDPFYSRLLLPSPSSLKVFNVVTFYCTTYPSSTIPPLALRSKITFFLIFKREFHGISQDFIGFRRFSEDFKGIGFHGNSQEFMRFRKTSNDFRRVRGIS